MKAGGDSPGRPDAELADLKSPPPLVVPKLEFTDSHRLRSRDVFRLIPRIWPFVRPYRKHIIFLVLMSIPLLPAGLLVIASTRIFYDVVGNGHPLTRGEALLIHVPLTASRETVLLHLIVLWAIIGAVAGPLGAVGVGYVLWLLQRITNLFRVDFYSRMQELSVRFHGEEKIGDAMFRMFQDSAALPQVIDALILEPLMLTPIIVAELYWLARFNSSMALIAMVLIPAYLVLAIYYSRDLRRSFMGEREATAQATTRIEETLSSIKTVKAFGTEQSEGRIYARDNWAAFIASRRARMMLVRYRVAANTILAFGELAALYIGARQVLLGSADGVFGIAVSLGTFQGTIAVLRQCGKRMHDLAGHWGGLQDTTVAMARVLEMLGSLPETDVQSGAHLPPPKIGTLVFEHVSFAYDPSEPVLCDASFDARAGTITALAGASGSGKSTIVSLVLRFFDPAAGRITAGGVEISEFQLPAWRAAISVALQENPLFTATIRDNIAYSSAGATADQISTAVRRAGLAEFINSLPDGLDTMLGEKGAKLSTGQVQRIGLARALLRDAQILLLDEPTASLDGATEALVLGGIREWVEDAPDRRIVIIATHRRTTAEGAEQIFAMADGRVVAGDVSSFDRPLLESRDG
jgi:ABC-type multidrug transport system fused ATPase/permease subunit